MSEDRRSEKADKPAGPDLRGAMRHARIEEAERAEAHAELKGAEMARLEILEEALAPVMAQIPREAEMFDCGLVPGARPRLFIDMIAHVEMGHDKRLYRFVQSRRHGRTILAESDRVDPMVDAVTAYIARRLIDREKELASVEATQGAGATPSPPAARPVDAPKPSKRRGGARPWFGALMELLLSYLGIVALCILLVVVARYAYDYWQHLGQ